MKLSTVLYRITAKLVKLMLQLLFTVPARYVPGKNFGLL